MIEVPLYASGGKLSELDTYKTVMSAILIWLEPLFKLKKTARREEPFSDQEGRYWATWKRDVKLP